MTDPLELFVREDLAALAARTPEAHDLAATAIRRAHAQRRRRAVWSTAGTLMVVLALGAAVLVAGRGQVPPTVPPAASASPVVTPGDQLAFDGVLHYRGAEVPVPMAWLHTDNIICDTAIRDAAYVIGPLWGHSTCAPPINLDQSALTEVALAPWQDDSGRESGEHVLPDGRTQLVTRVPAADLRFVVTSPDPDLARRIFDGLVVTAPGRCSGLRLTSSDGDTARMSDRFGGSTLTVHVGDTITAQSDGACSSLSLGLRPADGTLTYQLVPPPDDRTSAQVLRAQHPGTVSVAAMAAMCDGLGPGCAGGVAMLGSVDVTVVAHP